MQTILITGGTGLVGSRLTELLVAKNYNIVFGGCVKVFLITYFLCVFEKQRFRVL
jgi:GDP-D-mannose dehydratase